MLRRAPTALAVTLVVTLALLPAVALSRASIAI